MSRTQTAQFAPGQVVRHRRFGYRGLIFDVDASFSQSPEWYEVMAETQPPKDRPWYHILVDGEKHTTYVSEQNLMDCAETDAFEHPLMSRLFRTRRSGDIATRAVMN